MNPALPATRKQKFLRETKDYLMIALGMIMYGIGWTVFLLPSDIPSGAVPGIASIIYWGTGFPVQYTYLIINFLLLLLALKILGLKFCLKTIFAVFTLTFILSVIQNFVTGELIHDQPFMSCVLGASFCGAVSESHSLPTEVQEVPILLRPLLISIVTSRWEGSS